jgi:uncharacterized protein (DUF2267 family)
MSMAEVASFEIAEAAQEARNWIGELMNELNCDERKAYLVLRAVLHGLRDRLSIDEVATLSAYLPTMIRGLFLEDWQPSRVATVRARPGVLDIGLQVEVIDEMEAGIAISAAAEMLDRRIAQARRAA